MSAGASSLFEYSQQVVVHVNGVSYCKMPSVFSVVAESTVDILKSRELSKSGSEHCWLQWSRNQAANTKLVSKGGAS